MDKEKLTATVKEEGFHAARFAMLVTITLGLIGLLQAAGLDLDDVLPATRADIQFLEQAQARDDALWANFNLMNLQVRLAQIQSEIDATGPKQTLIQIKADLERQIREQTQEYEDASRRAREA